MSGEGMIAEPRAMHGGSAGGTRLAELMHRGTEFLGCDYAILGGAMILGICHIIASSFH